MPSRVLSQVVPMSEPILAPILAAYADAVWRKDAPAFLALYAPGFRGFDLWGDWVQDGVPVLAAMVDDWFGSLGEERVRVTIHDLRETPGVDLALGEATIRFAAIALDGAEIRSLENRASFVARRSDDGWRILHQHTSVPLDQNGQPQFRRPVG